MTSPKPITLEEQIEAVDAEVGYRSTFNLRHPSVEGTRHLVRLEAAAATLRELHMKEKWEKRDLSKCRCDHNEYCDYCYPPEFRHD